VVSISRGLAESLGEGKVSVVSDLTHYKVVIPAKSRDPWRPGWDSGCMDPGFRRDDSDLLSGMRKTDAS
jgi:hypothetical protein